MKRTDFEQYKRILRTAAIVIIILLEALIFKYVWSHYYSKGLWIEPFYAKGNTYIVLVYVIFLLMFMYVYGGLKVGILKKTNLIYSQALSGLCANVVMYFQIVLLSRTLVTFVPILVMTLIEIMVIAVFAPIFEFVYARIFPPRQLLLIYDTYAADDLFMKMNNRRDKYRIAKKINIKVGNEKIFEEILKYDGVVVYDVHAALRNKILKFCYANSKRIYMTPKISDIIIRSSETLHIFDTPLLLARNYGLTFEQRLAKRFVDIIVSAVMLLITSPIMLVAAIAIKSYDRGPALFKQNRLTIDGKVFSIYKFRSMIVNAEKDGVARLASENDSRITPVGNLIRKTRVDELPQLINVLKGEMSLVGPRPERPEIAEEYEKVIPEFSYRLKVKAGLTGYAQLYGKYNTTAYDKLKLDLMYIQSYSIILDVKLLIMTFKILFMKESTEGVEADQITAIKKEGDKTDFTE